MSLSLIRRRRPPDLGSSFASALLSSLTSALRSASFWRRRAAHWRACYVELESRSLISDAQDNEASREISDLREQLERSEARRHAVTSRIAELEGALARTRGAAALVAAEASPSAARVAEAARPSPSPAGWVLPPGGELPKAPSLAREPA